MTLGTEGPVAISGVWWKFWVATFRLDVFWSCLVLSRRLINFGEQLAVSSVQDKQPKDGSKYVLLVLPCVNLSQPDLIHFAALTFRPISMLRIENREHLLVHAVSVIKDDSRYSLEHAGSQISLARGQDGHFTTSSLSSPQLIVFLMFFLNILYIYIQRNNLQGPPIFQGKTMVSCRFSILSLISIH